MILVMRFPFLLSCFIGTPSVAGIFCLIQFFYIQPVGAAAVVDDVL